MHTAVTYWAGCDPYIVRLCEEYIYLFTIYQYFNRCLFNLSKAGVSNTETLNYLKKKSIYCVLGNKIQVILFKVNKTNTN